MRWTTLVLVVVFVACMSGCVARQEPLIPTSAVRTPGWMPPGKQKSAPPPPGPVGPFPTRTRDVDLDDANPCTALTEAQMRKLRYDLGYARPPRPDRSDIHGGPDCTYASNGGSGGPSRDVTSLIGFSLDHGVENALPLLEHEPVAFTIDPDGRGPFHAVASPHPLESMKDSCYVVVDTGPDQYLEVSSGYSGITTEGPERFCKEAREVAALVLANILAGT